MASKKQGPKKRVKPRVSLSIPPEVHQRILELQRILPGASFSGIVGELLKISLPAMEAMTDAMTEARLPDGSVDEQRARDRLARWAGAQLLGLSDTYGSTASEEGSKTAA